jgi:hypothetical protein
MRTAPNGIPSMKRLKRHVQVEKVSSAIRVQHKVYRAECWGKCSSRALSDSRSVPYCTGVERGGFSHQSQGLASDERRQRPVSSARAQWQSRVLDPPRQRDTARCRATGDGGPTTWNHCSLLRSGRVVRKIWPRQRCEARWTDLSRARRFRRSQRPLLAPCTCTEPPTLTQVLVPGI